MESPSRISNHLHATEGADFCSASGCYPIFIDFTFYSIIFCFFYNLVNIIFTETAFVISNVDFVLPASIFVCSRYPEDGIGDPVKGHLGVRNTTVS